MKLNPETITSKLNKKNRYCCLVNHLYYIFVYLYNIICYYYITLIIIDSRDNISAIVAFLPGVVIGSESGGGVARLRADRTKSNNKHLKSSLDGEEHSG